MTLTALIASIALTGFSLSWSSSPAQSDSPGAAVITLSIEESDLIAVATAEGSAVSYEVTATVDGSGFIRRGDRGVNSSFPLSEILEYNSLEPGGHIVAVTLTDLESGSVTRIEEEIFIDTVTDELWSSGALRITPEGPVRASGYISLTWSLYYSGEEEIPQAAYAVLNSSTDVVREGWLEAEESEDGVINYNVDVVLNALPKGRYRITAAALESETVVAASSSSILLLDAWDIWGDDPEVTTTLIRPIASSHELRELERAGGLGDRNSVMADFWNRRDPNPATRGNEYLEEYLQRLDYISREFTTTGTQGINTDRGIIYAKLGEADIVANYPFEVGYYPYITWEYFTPSLNLTFVDHGGYGYYELVEEWGIVDRAFNAREEWSQ